jgi:hypothetical protein
MSALTQKGAYLFAMLLTYLFTVGLGWWLS